MEKRLPLPVRLSFWNKQSLKPGQEALMDSLTELFCLIDDFCQAFEPAFEAQLLADGARKRRRACGLRLSELMTLMVLFHQVRFRQFKFFYEAYVCRFLRREFQHLPSYSRCVQLMPRCAVALCALFEQLKGRCSGLSIADSTTLAVCDNRRIAQHKVFDGLAARGKTSTGWFFGFKLHVIINHLGELLGMKLTPGHVDDRQPLPDLCTALFGKLYADKGYLAKWLTEKLHNQGIALITKLRKNMKPVVHSAFDQALLRRRSLIETVFDQLKNLWQIEHSRHRSVNYFLVNLIAGVVAYCLAPNKPRLPVSCFNSIG
jgi:transposase